MGRAGRTSWPDLDGPSVWPDLLRQEGCPGGGRAGVKSFDGGARVWTPGSVGTIFHPPDIPHDPHRDPPLELLLWIGFFALVLTLLAIDLGVHRKQYRILPLREALAWTGFYVALALAFSVFVYLVYEHDWMAASATIREDLSGGEAALYFFTAWILEWSLALDNIFVIALIFSFFQVPAGQQHRVLFWGILGALVFRALMIIAGVTLIHRFGWIVYLFGGLLLFTAMRLLVARHDNLTPDRNPLVKFCHRCIPMTEGFRGSAFFVREGGRLHATPLALALMVVESTDLLFAVDSIPAALAITTDPFLVFTSNIFAVLGLRALYFALAALLERFRYLKMSLVFVLAFVGIKFILSPHFHLPPWVSLAVIAGFLGVGALASVLYGDTAPLLSPLRGEAGPVGEGGGSEGRRTPGREEPSPNQGS